MEELLNKLIERDMMLATDEEAEVLAVYAKEKGYFAKKFSYRNRPHVTLKRNGPGSIAKPLCIFTMSIEECHEKIEFFNSELEKNEKNEMMLSSFSHLLETNRINEEITFYKSVLKRLQN